MGFTGVNPPAAYLDEAGLASFAKSSASPMEAGSVYFHKTSTSQWSILKLYKSAATIAKGAALVGDTASRDPNQVKESGTAEGALPVCKGIAAAAVSNTGYFFFGYIAGYCPDAAVNSGFASNQYMRLSGTTAGKFGSIPGVNATLGTSTFATISVPIIKTLGAEPTSTGATDAFTTVSCLILGWLGG